MATWFSDHYSDGDGENALPATPVRPGAGIGHARLRYKRASITVPATVALNDVFRMMTFRSGDRVKDIRVHSDDGFTAGATLDLGLHLTGTNHDGAVVDADLFVDGADLGTGFDDASGWEGSLVGADRGKPLWEVAGESANPKVDYDMTVTFAGDATTGGTVAIEVEYTAGD